jgi:tetratricopeptide (TPR) repeat protein
MITDREYHAGIHCLKVGIELAEQEKREEQAIDLHLQLADVLNNAGHAPLAAEEIKQTLDKYVKSSEYGKVATLRLKYLYEAGQFDKILEEAPTYQADERCKPYLPQIIYISWVAHRRENKLAEADKLQKDFLEKFPEHPLAADLYFAAAMTALAKSDYEEASRLLEIIQYRYPKSKIIDKAKQIQERLKQNLGQKITK